MNKYIATMALLVTELFYMRLWLACKELKDFFYFSVQNVQLIVIDHIHNDGGLPVTLVRILHNKATVGIIELIRHYLYFWDIRFLVPLLSPIGFFALLAGFWYILRAKLPLIYKSGILFVLLSIPAVEMIIKPQVPFAFRLVLLGVPYVAISLVGILHFIRGSRQPIRYTVCIFLLMLSIWWYMVFQAELTNLCVNP
jgi:hypothetical protein